MSRAGRPRATSADGDRRHNTAHFTLDSVSDPSGKVIAITGRNSQCDAPRMLALQKAPVVLAGRDARKTAEAKRHIETEESGSALTLVPVSTHLL